jgi:uncharacterized protein YggE
MRLVITIMMLGLAVPAAAGVPGLSLAQAQSPVTTQPLATGEVLLEVNALGTVTSRADTVTITVGATAEAADAASARRLVQGQLDRLTAIALAHGVVASDILKRATGAELMEFDVANALPSPPSIRPARGSTRSPVPTDENRATASGSLEIRLRDLGRLDELRDALTAAGASNLREVAYSLANEQGARDAARRQAIANARAEAEATAAELGMRVLRIVRVTDRVGIDLIGTMMSEESRMRRMVTGMAGSDENVTTTVPVGIDFALAPR